MRRHQVLSDNELAVLHAMWSAGKPLSRPEILTHLEDNDWNPNSIHLVLNNLIKKGYVVVDGLARCGQSYGRSYAAAKTQGEYAADVALSALEGVPDEGKAVTLMAAMVKGKHINLATIEELERILKQCQQELEKSLE